MAAIGGEVVPTNWSGLIGVVVLVGVIAAATYFGLHMTEEEKGVKQDDSLTVQEVFSSSARREVAAAEPARALARADFAAPVANPSATTADDQDTSAADADADAADDDAMDTEQVATDDWDAPVEEEKPAPVKQEVAKASKPAPSRSTPREAEPEVVDARKRPAAEALVAWWKDAGDGLEVRFAGTLDRGGKVSDGVAVMFGEAVAPTMADKFLMLTDANGNTIKGRWKIGANPTLLMMDGLNQGRYRLTIGAGLPGESGRTLAKTVAGPIFVY